jgi:hypothetical protein
MHCALASSLDNRLCCTTLRKHHTTSTSEKRAKVIAAKATAKSDAEDCTLDCNFQVYLFLGLIFP